MADLPLDQAVARFQENEERIDKFVNAPNGEDVYETSQGEQVPVLPKMLPQVLSLSERAESAAVVAEAARDTTLLDSLIASDIAEGLASTSPDSQPRCFRVVSGDAAESFIYYRHDPGGVATELKRVSSEVALQQQAARIDQLNERIADTPDASAVTIEDDQGRIAAAFDDEGNLHASSARFDSLSTPAVGFERPSRCLAQSVSDAAGGEAYGADAAGNFRAPAVVTGTVNGIPVASFSRTLGERFAANRVSFANEGQSNAAGQVPAVHTAQVFDAVGFPAHSTTPTELLPMTAANCSSDSNKETPAYGAIDYLKQLILSELGIDHTEHEYQPVLLNTAYSGFSIDQLSTGTASYNEFVGQLQAAFNISQAEGKSIVHLANFWSQGEGNYRDSLNGYYSQLLTYHAGREAAARAITGQHEPVYTIASQVNSSGHDFVQSVALAALAASEDHPHIVLACPTYMREFIDDVHGTGQSLDIEGAYLGLAAFLTLVREQKFEPLKAVSSRLQGRIQEVTFNKAGLTLATSATVPAIPQFGFQMLTPGGTEIALESAAVTGPRTVRFVWASPPPAGAMWWAGGKRISTGKGAYLGSCINLRDSQGDSYSYKSTPLHNWCVVQTMDPRGYAA